MKIVIAPDSFKESLTATAVAGAIARGVLEVRPDARIDLCPMADGGEGTVEAVVAATTGEIRTADVFDPLGAPIRARFGLLGPGGGAGLPGEVGLSAAMGSSGEQATAAGEGDGKIAVVEMAAASGLALVPPERRDPLRTTTFGTGQLILAALETGAREILVGIGGSATMDGGCGCAQALGVVFIDGQCKALVCGVGGGGLGDIEDIDISDRDPRIPEARIRAACDVTNPLTGPNGAASVYAPQKGATPEVVEQLEAHVVHLAEVIRNKMSLDVEKLPGAGAAGGLGAGLVAFAGATLEAGVEAVAEVVGLARRLRGADLCITGEGKFDSQSRSGKTVVGVAKLAKLAGVPTICIPGQATAEAPHDLFAAVRPLVGGQVEEKDALARPEFFLQRRAAEAVKKFVERQ